jgi:DNA-binding transcriptional LysR family regulator
MSKADVDQIKLRRLDFSMLVIFRDLVRLQKTTAVSAQLGLSQSAISHALARLRNVLADPLFLRRPSGLEPTQRAMELLPKVETILRLAQDVLNVPTQFNPASSTRSFRLAGNGLIGALITPSLVNLLGREAPGCRVACQFEVGAASLNGLRTNDLDVAIGRIWNLAADFQATPVFEENFAVVVRKNHPAIRSQMTLEDYLALAHILVSNRGGFTGMVDQALKRNRLKRHVVASVPTFVTAMTTVAHTNLAATVPSRLAAKHARPLGLAVFAPPLKADSFTICLVRHARSRSDLGLDWFAARIVQAGQS